MKHGSKNPGNAEVHLHEKKGTFPIRETFARMGKAKVSALLMLATDICFFAAATLWSIIGTIAINLLAASGGSSPSYVHVLLYSVVSFAVLVALAAGAKVFHLRLAHRIMGGAGNRASYLQLLAYSGILWLVSSILLFGSGWLAELFGEVVQTAIFFITLLVALFLFIWAYSSQWLMSRGKGLWQSIKEGISVYRNPARPLSIMGFMVLAEFIVLVIYVASFAATFSANAPITGKVEDFMGQNGGFVKGWSAAFGILTYIIFFLARLMTYEMAESRMQKVHAKD